MDSATKAIRQRFFKLNTERLRRTMGAVHARQRVFLDVLPLLFHANHPQLPGFITEETPMGVSDYWETPEALHAAKQINKDFDFRRSIPRLCEIHSIFLIGSTGTVAQSKSSDFDIWICHGPELDRNRLAALREKCNSIEKWAEQIGLETHFFLMEAQSFREGRVLDISSESSGSAQHHLLLDEFYRTSLLLAGRYPVWWLVPPERERDYQACVKALLDEGEVSNGEIIDFGGMGQIPAEEFFGAAVWQLYKGVDSPYKSVLKILLMETYASEHPNVDALSVGYKKAVYAGEDSLDRLDPYVMLIGKLTDYLAKCEATQRMDLVRRCAYFKIGMPLSKLLRGQEDGWRKDIMNQMIGEWGWDAAKLRELDSRSSWKIDQVLQERKILVEDLTNSYFFLSKFARDHSGLVMISQRDLTLLGRKLYAAFERKAGKIEMVNPGIASELHEAMLSIVYRKGKDGRKGWFLYRDNDNRSDPLEGAPLKKASNLMELLLWCHYNRIVDARTMFSLHTKGSTLTNKELCAVIDSLRGLYPDARLPEMEIEDLAKRPRLVSASLFLNVGADPELRYNRGRQLIGGGFEGVGYEGLIDGMVCTADAIYTTSWQEVHTYHHTGLDGLFDALCQYLQWVPLKEGLKPPPIKMFCFTPTYSEQIIRRVRDLYLAVTSAFYGSRRTPNTRYLLEVEGSYFLIYDDDGVIKHLRFEDDVDMMRNLTAPQSSFSPLVIDRHALSRTVYPAIYRYNKPDVIQTFLRSERDALNIYVLDERGSLFTQKVASDDADNAMAHLIAFYNAVINRQSFLVMGEGKREPVDCLEFYTVTADAPGRLTIERKDVERLLDVMPMRLQAIGDYEDPASEFSIYCGEREFTSAEHGERIFEAVARSILEQRRERATYPVYVTDIDVPPASLGAGSQASLQTLYFLNYKRKLERQLSQALQAL